MLKSLSDFNLYDISFYKDDEKVTIDGIATVKIPVGDKDPEKCKVYYYDNGKYVWGIDMKKSGLDAIIIPWLYS